MNKPQLFNFINSDGEEFHQCRHNKNNYISSILPQLIEHIKDMDIVQLFKSLSSDDKTFLQYRHMNNYLSSNLPQVSEHIKYMSKPQLFTSLNSDGKTFHQYRHVMNKYNYLSLNLPQVSE